MAKVKVEVTGAYVDGQGPGSIVTVDEKVAEHLERNGYGKKVEEPKTSKTEAKEEEPKPKRRTRKKAKKDEE